MKTMSRIFLMGAFAAGSLGFAGAAHAHSDVSWALSIGSPGVALGVVQPGPVFYGAPIYSVPIYVQPRPVYHVRHRHYRPLRQMRAPYRMYGPPAHMPRPVYRVPQYRYR